MGGGLVLHECPISYVDDGSYGLINLFDMCSTISWRDGGADISIASLPREGGVNDQDNFTMEAFQVISMEKQIVYQEKAEIARKVAQQETNRKNRR